jgi:signal transduction histidine kinase
VILVRFQFHERKALPWQLMAGAILTALLALLATLQYRWLGEVGEAEAARMRDGLRTRAADFTLDFDRELTQIYVAVHADPGVFNTDMAAAIGAVLAKARATATVPGLIKDVFVLEAQGPNANVLQHLDPAGRALQPAEWPPALLAWRARLERHGPVAVAGTVLPNFMGDAVDAAVPALIIPLTFVRTIAGGQGRLAVLPDPGAGARELIVTLDADRLRHQLLETLIAKYFGAPGDSQYLVSIVQRDDPSHVIYASVPDAVMDQRVADVSAGFFDLRMNEMARLSAGPRLDGARGTLTQDRVAITIVRRAAGPGDAARMLMTGDASQGAWLLRARYRSGSLESIVSRSRRRNMAISLGVLGLLAAAFVLVMAAAQRQQRLARQQMEFVAAVSHELRTPLAVICSAGENLADGVVAEAAQVKSYGALIETEGRRLGDMVERVMQFAGISSGTPIRWRRDIDVRAIVAAAVAGVKADALDRGVTVAVHPEGALPAVDGDPDALASALQNIVGNAVKYSPRDATVDVTTRAHDGRVQIRVADRGLGIDAADLPHLFKPFFRGRRAVDAQVRGSGVGLSIVRHVVDAHQATIAVESRVGEGTTVTLELLPPAIGQSLEARSAAE